MKTIHLLTLLSIALMAVACGGAAEPDLALPTPAVIATVATQLPAPTQAATQATATLPPAPTLPPATIAATAVPPTPTAIPTTVPPMLAPTQPAAGAGGDYQVAFVESNDVLNVRSGPGANYPAVAELPPIAAGIEVVPEGQTLTAGSTWVAVEAPGVEGWANSRFLTESVPPAEFCADPEVQAILDRLRQAIQNQDGRLLASLIHPERGLRLRLSWWNEEVLVPGEDVAGLFTSPTAYDWGMNEGSGEPVSGSFSEVLLPFLQKDLLGATESACDEILHGPTAGMMLLPEGYQQVHSFTLYRPAPADSEFDWGTWAVGIERWEGQYHLSYLVHYRYEI